ncbi:hypothetical protein C427_1268 [Paraglaciecola psychrophila 170]|uniref:Uncharacterized protein n=1 Tax=Paraglaciecola psychrophila 170 TaxID=1129794 RepID=K7AK31_9ALTE|nr:hypothetical protein C427_1268 [Paraglaciecola psychrophila 170]GAC35825.1 hypothetical protein GPSY_0183 [Paraglaciecola psychrophila 170]
MAKSATVTPTPPAKQYRMLGDNVYRLINRPATMKEMK